MQGSSTSFHAFDLCRPTKASVLEPSKETSFLSKWAPDAGINDALPGMALEQQLPLMRAESKEQEEEALMWETLAART